MTPSTPSAEAEADEAFRDRRVARLRRGRRRLGAAGGLVVALVVLVALAVTVRNSAPDDSLAERADDPALIAATAKRQDGTTCVGWPVALTPSVRPADRQGAVTVWGDRSAIHLRNPGGEAVVVEVRPEGGEARGVEGDVAPVPGGLRVALGPGGEARFTVACSATALRFSVADAAGRARTADALQFGTGAEDGPLTIEKVGGR